MKIFKKSVFALYGEEARPFKSDTILHQEAQFWLREGFSVACLYHTLRDHVAKMHENKHRSPTCISALKHSLEDALNSIKRIKDYRAHD